MEWIDRYQDEIAAIFAMAEEETTKYPAPLDELGRAWVQRLNPLRGARSNYIGYLLPYWMRDAADVELAACRELAAANIHALIHFFLLDDVIDTGPGMDKAAVRDALVLGQLFQASFQQRYTRYYTSESPIWSHYQRYLAEWAHAVAREKDLQADPDDVRQLAGKSAPVKLSAAAMLLLADRSDMLPEMEEAVELTLATLQLSDDWADWREDLAEGNDSAFLSLVRRCLRVETDHPLDEQQVKRAIYHAGCLDRLADIVESYLGEMEKLAHVPPMLDAFHRALALGIRADASAAAESAKTLATGGIFDYFLSNLTKN
jgi:hypothetical protein